MVLRQHRTLTLAAPRPTAADGPDTRTGAQRTADALVELARRSLAAGDLPDDGGEPPQVVITTTDTLPTPVQARGRRAAQTRWQGRRGTA